MNLWLSNVTLQQSVILTNLQYFVCQECVCFLNLGLSRPLFGFFFLFLGTLLDYNENFYNGK